MNSLTLPNQSFKRLTEYGYGKRFCKEHRSAKQDKQSSTTRWTINNTSRSVNSMMIGLANDIMQDHVVIKSSIQLSSNPSDVRRTPPDPWTLTPRLIIHVVHSVREFLRLTPFLGWSFWLKSKRTMLELFCTSTALSGWLSDCMYVCLSVCLSSWTMEPSDPNRCEGNHVLFFPSSLFHGWNCVEQCNEMFL